MNVEELLSKIAWNDQGLVPAITQDEDTGEVLMMAWMNAESLKMTFATRKVTYYSRSRRELWIKGATSGNIQEFVSLTADCDFDTLLIQIRQTGAACHTGSRSCFFNEITG